MIEGNELRVYGDRAVSELTTLRHGVCGAGDSGQEHGHPEKVRERGRLGQRLASRAQLLGRAEGASGHGQIFTAGVRGGNLKTWKTEKLASSEVQSKNWHLLIDVNARLRDRN